MHDPFRLRSLGADLTQPSYSSRSNIKRVERLRWGILGAELMASKHDNCIEAMHLLALLVVRCSLGRSRSVGEPLRLVLVVEWPCWDDDLVKWSRLLKSRVAGKPMLEYTGSV